MSVATDLRIAPISLTGRQNTADGAGAKGGLLEEIRSAADRGADLIMLPQLSFSPYFPAQRDREALELGERFPSKTLTEAREAAGDSWLAASGYECVGEGVFYVRGELGTGPGGCRLVQRQHRVEAADGRYEQMFFSPGHGARQLTETPWGRAGMLIGADVRDIAAWNQLAEAGADLVIGSASETPESWQGTCRIAAGLATVHGITLGLVNRAPADDESQFAGGSLVLDSQGREVAADEDGHFHIQVSEHETAGEN